MLLTTTELAGRLGLSKGRISQYVSEGKLEGCYQGENRNRRFDLDKVAKALGKRLDQGQLMGNGSATRAALKDLDADGGEAPKARSDLRDGSELPKNDDDRYQLARTQLAEEQARRMRRQNAVEDGTYVLASEARLATERLLAQEISEFEQVLRDGARQVADELGVDFKSARAILIRKWRDHREKRSARLVEEAGKAGLSEAEREADI